MRAVLIGDLVNGVHGPLPERPRRFDVDIVEHGVDVVVGDPAKAGFDKGQEAEAAFEGGADRTAGQNLRVVQAGRALGHEFEVGHLRRHALGRGEDAPHLIEQNVARADVLGFEVFAEFLHERDEIRKVGAHAGFLGFAAELAGPVHELLCDARVVEELVVRVVGEASEELEFPQDFLELRFGQFGRQLLHFLQLGHVSFFRERPRGLVEAVADSEGGDGGRRQDLQEREEAGGQDVQFRQGEHLFGEMEHGGIQDFVAGVSGGLADAGQRLLRRAEKRAVDGNAIDDAALQSAVEGVRHLVDLQPDGGHLLVRKQFVRRVLRDLVELPGERLDPVLDGREHRLQRDRVAMHFKRLPRQQSPERGVELRLDFGAGVAGLCVQVGEFADERMDFAGAPVALQNGLVEQDGGLYAVRVVDGPPELVREIRLGVDGRLDGPCPPLSPGSSRTCRPSPRRTPQSSGR